MDTNLVSLREKTILLAGSGRSGTTWLGNILAANLDYRIIFEPLDAYHVTEAAVLPRRAYLRPEGDYPQWELFLYNALSGQISNEWTLQEGRRPWARKFLVKEIRANLMLGWITNHLRPRVIYLTRHPCSVVLSRLKLRWVSNPIGFLQQEELVQDHLGPYVKLIENAQTDLQKHALSWAIENLVAMAQQEQFDWTFVTYEGLYLNPEAEAHRVLAAVDARPTWLTRRAIHKVSSVTRADSAVVSGRSPLLEWQRVLDKDQVAVILDTIAEFAIDLYGATPLPKTLDGARLSQAAEGAQPALIDGMVS